MNKPIVILCIILLFSNTYFVIYPMEDEKESTQYESFIDALAQDYFNAYRNGLLDRSHLMEEVIAETQKLRKTVKYAAIAVIATALIAPAIYFTIY